METYVASVLVSASQQSVMLPQLSPWLMYRVAVAAANSGGEGAQTTREFVSQETGTIFHYKGNLDYCYRRNYFLLHKKQVFKLSVWGTIPYKQLGTPVSLQGRFRCCERNCFFYSIKTSF